MRGCHRPVAQEKPHIESLKEEVVCIPHCELFNKCKKKNEDQ